MKILPFGFIISSIILINCQVIEELTVIGNEKPKTGDNVTVTCQGVGEELHWKHRKKSIISSKKWKINTKDENDKLKSELLISNVTLEESGKYKCVISSKEGTDDRSIAIHVQAGPVFLNVTNATTTSGMDVVLTCTAMAAPPPKIIWFKENTNLNELPRYYVNNSDHSTLHVTSLEIQDAEVTDSGSYKCTMENKYGTIVGMPYLIVQDVPKVRWKLARSLGPSLLHLEWQVEDNPLPLLESKIFIFGLTLEESITLQESSTIRKVLNISDTWKGLIDEELQVYLQLSNSIGSTDSEVKNVTMLKQIPVYTPEGSVKGSTKDSLSASWTTPPELLKPYVGFFELSLKNTLTNETLHIIRNFSQNYLFVDLDGGTTYEFSVLACMGVFDDKEHDCGKSSLPVSGRTLFNPPEGVADVVVRCISNRTTGYNYVFIRWLPPTVTDHVDNYKITVLSSAQYVNEKGSLKRYIGQISKHWFAKERRNVTIGDLSPNTNYTIRVYAGIGNVFSSALSANCETPIWLPRKHNLNWWKFRSGPRTVLKMQTPYVSERNGTICCHRIVVVKLMENKTLHDLPHPQNMPILSFDEVHAGPVIGGYVAEAFSGRSISSSYLLLGDDKTIVELSPKCAHCLGIEPVAAASIDDNTVENNAEKLSQDEVKAALPYTKSLRREIQPMHIAQDKHLLKDSNYTGFLIMSVRDRNGSVMSRFSNYFNVIQPKADPLHLTSAPSSNSSFSNVLYILGAFLILLILTAVALIMLLVYYHRRRKMLVDDLMEESLTGSLGRIFRTLRRSHTLMSQPGVEVLPIQKDDLIPQYLEKMKDSDLGFRREFEALPEKFYDRSSKGSEMSDNGPKNRYPDIKAYDQTRVILSQIKGLVTSDYINANFVLGYKERKKFICAQGPMESTVNDFWRMIVEQRSSLCIMLTNLEETGKVKCVKYWPEAGEPKTFGNITVRLVKEKPYADYLVRTLRAEWQVPSSAQSSEATETDNGTDTLKSTNGTTSNYNSLSSNSNTTSEETTKFHEVQQYHYLMWKDFIAPEHPVGLLSFLRRINEAYSPDMGPLLVHCSAGVGRTGTLVALNSLVSELDEEGQASIFNVICDLRHQRNFLVQSLKQYVFVHRALMEHAQFGNTELSISVLKTTFKNHTQHQGDEAPELQKEYERLGKVIEDRKAFTVANNDANKNKNRYDFVLPYDTNCVILQPLPKQIGATYINASFMTGFDLGENFIVTQDPLENTVADFWRMVYEQGATTVVMLSELGSGEDCCSKYWPDEEETHEYLTVKFLSSESYPKYNTRTFLITNNKNNDTMNISQFQYVGWSGLMGEVPLVTHGIMEVIARVQAHIDGNMATISHTVVHCSGGGDRSSVYVCLNNCLRLLRRESCVDVFQTVRKIRAQRQYQIQSLAQYEFIYKALVEYIDLKGEANL